METIEFIILIILILTIGSVALILLYIVWFKIIPEFYKEFKEKWLKK